MPTEINKTSCSRNNTVFRGDMKCAVRENRRGGYFSSQENLSATFTLAPLLAQAVLHQAVG